MGQQSAGSARWESEVFILCVATGSSLDAEVRVENASISCFELTHKGPWPVMVQLYLVYVVPGWGGLIVPPRSAWELCQGCGFDGRKACLFLIGLPGGVGFCHAPT